MNRTIFRQRIIKRLTQKGIKVFNEVNILKKYKFQTNLEANHEFHRCLPETKVGNLQNLKEMMQKYSQLIPKPDNGIVGKGILKLQKVNEGEWCLSYKSRKGKKVTGKKSTLTIQFQKFYEKLWKETSI